MIKHHISKSADPFVRGRDLGARFASEAARSVEVYKGLFAVTSGNAQFDLDGFGRRALAVIDDWAPYLGQEIRGFAAGAGVPETQIAAINARTEALGACRAAPRGDCSVVAWLGESGILASQNWDWHDELADCWFVHTIVHPGGRVVHTLTEVGIVGKIGLNSDGIGLMLNILRHSEDRETVGVPIHVLARRVLDEASNANEALRLIAQAEVSASSSMTVLAAEPAGTTAVSVELSTAGPAYVLPEDGLLVHTNHFLSAAGQAQDLERRLGPDSIFRLEVLRRHLKTGSKTSGTLSEEDILEALSNHVGSTGAVCCHPAASATLGQRYATLANVTMRPERFSMTVRAGTTCEENPQVWDSGSLPQDAF